MEYTFVKGLFVPPGTHRLYNATGLSVGLLAGRQLMNIIVGHTPDGTPLEKDSVPLPLRPLLGVMNYNVYSDDPRDRWLHAIDNMAPALLGAVGVLASSRVFFKDRLHIAAEAEKLALSGAHLKNAPGSPAATYGFAEADRAISARHAEPWGISTAISSLFGSASGFNLLPWPGNYAMSLGGLYGLRGGRKVGMASSLTKEAAGASKSWFRNPMSFLTNTTANSPFGPEDMVRHAITHIMENPNASVAQLPELHELANGVLRSWVRHVKPEHAEALAQDIHAYTRSLQHSAQDKAASDQALKAYISQRFETFLLEHKLVDMSSWQAVQKSLTPGNNGWLGSFAEFFGAKPHADALRESFAKGFYERNYHYAQHKGMTVGPQLAHSADAIITQPKASHTFRNTALATGAGLLGMAAVGSWAGNSTNERDPHRPGPTHRLAALVNDKPLDAIEWIGNALNFPPSLHRWKNALGLSTGLYSGMKIMELATGMSIRGTPLSEFKIFPFMPAISKIPVKPLLAYNFHGAGLADRWMKVAHMVVPAALGFYGSKLGSDWYFQTQRQRVSHPEYIDDFSSRIAFDQSKPWGYLSAATSLTNVGVGLNFLPLSYGMNLGTRFTLGSDRRVILPGVKEVWSNNHSRFPLGPSKLRDFMINYVVNNPDQEPRQLEDMVKGILGPWFGSMPNSVINHFADDVLTIRNKFYVEGGIPKDKRAQCKKELREHFVGKGLHKELESLGLDVLKAHLADNGLSGDIANHLGARAAVTRDIADFRDKELKRRGAHTTESKLNDPVEEDRRPTYAERITKNRDQQQGTSVATVS